MASQTPHPTLESLPGPSTASVVLLHSRPGKPDHYDWLIEMPGRTDEHRLMSFRSSFRPDEMRRDCQYELVQTTDHRAHYLTYEGPIQGTEDDQKRGGEVKRVASGRCSNFDHKTNPVTLGLAIDWGDGATSFYEGQRNAFNEWLFQRRLPAGG